MKTKKVLKEELKEKYLRLLIEKLSESEEDVMQVGSNELTFPVLDEEQDEHFITIKVSIPTGSRNDDGSVEPYDGYVAHQDYMDKVEEKRIKEEEKAKKKKEKIERDKKERERKAQLKAQREKGE